MFDSVLLLICDDATVNANPASASTLTESVAWATVVASIIKTPGVSLLPPTSITAPS